MKTNKQTNNPFFWVKRNLLKLFSMILMISIVTFFSCQEEVDLELEQEALTENEISSQMLDIQEKNVGETPLNEGMVLREGEPAIAGCDPAVNVIDYLGTPALANISFYNGTTLNEVGRASGRCYFPASLNQPCRFAGSVTVNSLPGTTGNYRVSTEFNPPNGTVSGTFTFVYGTRRRAQAVYCGFQRQYIVEAEDPTSPGTWVKVFEVTFTCSKCEYATQIP